MMKKTSSSLSSSEIHHPTSKNHQHQADNLNEKIRFVQERKKSLDQLKHQHAVNQLQETEQKSKHALDHKRQSIDNIKDKAIISNLDSQEGHERHEHQLKEQRRRSLNEFEHHLSEENLANERRHEQLSAVKEKQKHLQKGDFHH